MRRGASIAGLATAIVVLLMAGVAQAVPASAPDDTAMVDGISVRTIAQAGNLIWVGGDFDTVKDANGNTIRSVSDLVAFKADASGALATGVNLPAVTKTGGNATVYDLSLLGNTLYLAGTFDKVDGQARSNVAAIDATTGGLLPFNTNAGPANAVLATPTAIYVGTGKLLSFQPNGANTPGYTALKTYIDATIRAHSTTPQVRDIKLQGSTLVAACQCDSITDANNPTAPGKLVKAVVEVNATTGALTSWVPASLPFSSAAFGITVIVHDFPGTSTPTVYLAAGGSDFTAAYDFASGAQRFKTDTSGSSQAVTWYQGALIIGGHFNWSDSPASTSGCGDNASPNTACYHSPKLVSMDAATGKVILGTNNLPWNPGICCAYNGVWALTTGDDGSTLHVGGEFTQVGGTWAGSGNNWTLNGAATQRYYARLGGPAVSIQTLTLTKTGTGTGAVTSNPAGINCGTSCVAEAHDFSLGQAVTLSALPDAGSAFAGWTGGGCSGTGTCSITMSQAQNVSARFDLPTYAVTVTKAGGGAGTVTSSPSGVNCGTTCSATFNGGTAVTLTAAPSGNNLFQGWSGACSGTLSCMTTMDAAKAVTATFAAGSKLTIVTAGTGSGTVSSSPLGISCPGTCDANFPTGSTAVVTAVPTAGSTFTGFTGGCVSATVSCNVSMGGNKSVTATFAAAQTLTVTPAGTGTGTVTSAPAGISCGATCAAGFANATSVTLSASATAGSTFAGWSGACTGTGTCVLAMTAARNVTATFTQTTQPVTLTIGGTGAVTSNPGGLNCSSSCSADFGQGSTVTLTATPGTNQLFTGWSGACSGTSACMLTMTAARSVTASFAQATQPLSVDVNGSGGGTVASSPAGISGCGSSCSAVFDQGTTVTLTATASAGSTFTGWGGGCTGTGTCVISMGAATSVTASFDLQRSLTVSTAGTGTGTVGSAPAGITGCSTTCQANFLDGAVVTLTATPGAGMRLTAWGGDAAACGNAITCPVTMDAARTVTATFAPITYILDVAVIGGGSVTSAPAGIACPGSCSAELPAGADLTLVPAADAGSVFTGWSGDCSGTTACAPTMNAARSITATFAVLRTLGVATVGPGTGSVTSSPGAIDCPGTCTYAFAQGTTATLSALPGPESAFVGWAGDAGACGIVPTCPVDMTVDRSVTATFEPVDHTLSVATNGTGTGSVTGSPAGIDCPATSCAAAYLQGTVLTLSAVADAGSVFTGWSASGCAGTAPCEFTMSAAATVTASFELLRTLSVSGGGSGSGSVTSTPGLIDCPASACSQQFASGLSVMLAASADPGSVFTGWSGDCADSGPCALTLSGDRSVTAMFEPIHPVHIDVIGGAFGSVTGPAGLSCGTTCDARILAGQTITLTATPATGATFTGWSGACAGTATTCDLLMDQARSATATFAPVLRQLTVSVGGSGAGGVTSAPAGIACPVTSCVSDFVDGATVTLTASPDAGSTFTGWTGACAGTGSCQIAMNAAKSVSASFTGAPSLVTVDDTDLTVAYNGWQGVSDPAANGGAYRVSSVTSDALTWKSATTTSLSWVTRKGPNRGIANVNIDGVDKGNVDLYAATVQGATVTYTGLTSKVHTVILTVTGTKNAASSGKDVVIDAFTVGASTAQESDASVTYGTWKSVANASAAGGGYRWASEATASVSVTFTGTAIDWITTRGGNFGKVAITIDGVNRGTVDLYAAAQQWQSPVSYAGLAPGSHTMVIQVLDQKNAASGSTKVFMDGFTVHA